MIKLQHIAMNVDVSCLDGWQLLMRVAGLGRMTSGWWNRSTVRSIIIVCHYVDQSTNCTTHVAKRLE